MKKRKLPDNFYEKVKPCLYARIGRELRLAHRVLDIGCGGCALGIFLKKTYRQRIIGVDISTDNFPRHDDPRTSRNPLRCIKADAASLNFVRDGSVDAVVTVWALHEMKKPAAILREACRTLRPGGKIVIVDFPRGSLAQRLWNESYYTVSEIDRMLKRAGFDEVRAKMVERRQIIWATGYRRAENG